MNGIFHIHVDGAILPKSLAQYAKEAYGFFDDDFEHRLTVEIEPGIQENLPGRQLTLKLRERARVREICEDLSDRATMTGFAGFIQSEFVMTEMLLGSGHSKYQLARFPFAVKSRRINPALGERFKTHELHLELSTERTDARVISELARSGMSVCFGAREVTFTASGTLDAIRAIQEPLMDYLRSAHGFDQAQLVTEATVFHSLHQMSPEHTPPVVQEIRRLESPILELPAAAAFSIA